MLTFHCVAEHPLTWRLTLAVWPIPYFRPCCWRSHSFTQKAPLNVCPKHDSSVVFCRSRNDSQPLQWPVWKAALQRRKIFDHILGFLTIKGFQSWALTRDWSTLKGVLKGSCVTLNCLRRLLQDKKSKLKDTDRWLLLFFLLTILLLRSLHYTLKYLFALQYILLIKKCCNKKASATLKTT